MFVAVAGVILMWNVCNATKNKKPHLIMVLQDDLGHWDTAFTGNERMAPVTGNVRVLLLSFFFFLHIHFLRVQIQDISGEGIILTNHLVYEWIEFAVCRRFCR